MPIQVKGFVLYTSGQGAYVNSGMLLLVIERILWPKAIPGMKMHMPTAVST